VHRNLGESTTMRRIAFFNLGCPCGGSASMFVEQLVIAAAGLPKSQSIDCC
jgi:hypothetical protein